MNRLELSRGSYRKAAVMNGTCKSLAISFLCTHSFSVKMTSQYKNNNFNNTSKNSRPEMHHRETPHFEMRPSLVRQLLQPQRPALSLETIQESANRIYKQNHVFTRCTACSWGTDAVWNRWWGIQILV